MDNLQFNFIENTTAKFTVVLFHGLFGSKENLTDLANFFAPKYSVVVFDLPNHGAADDLPCMNFSNINTYLMQHLINIGRTKNLILIGHSIGGRVAMQFAAAYQDAVVALASLEMAPKKYPINSHNEIFAILQKVNTNIANKTKLAIQQELLASGLDKNLAFFFLKSYNKLTHHFNFNIQNLLDNYPVIMYWQNIIFPKPTLFLRGEYSVYINPVTDLKMISQNFPQAQLKTVLHAGHYIHIENPAATKKYLSDFLCGIDSMV